MQHVVTLTADPATRPLDDTVVARVRSAIGNATDPDWLSPGAAADIEITTDAPDQTLQAARNALEGIPADVNIQPADGRRKRILIADMDSTIITSETLDDLADFIGIKDRIAPVTARAMRGEIGFEAALRERVLHLKGHPASLLDRLLEERIELTPGATQLVRTMTANGAFTALVSGGFTHVTNAVAKWVGFQTNRGNVLEVEDGAFTGTVAEPILGQDAKVTALHAFCADLGTDPEAAMTVGDGANDLAMLKAAGTGVAFRAKPAVTEAAAFRIQHADLTGLLYLQGYRETDFVD